jgi:hypothetical protein
MMTRVGRPRSRSGDSLRASHVSRDEIEVIQSEQPNQSPHVHSQMNLQSKL